MDPKTAWREREHGVASEHTLFTSIEKIEKGLGKTRTERNNDFLLDYSINNIDLNKIAVAKIANKVEVEYSWSVKNLYEYDSETQVYKDQ